MPKIKDFLDSLPPEEMRELIKELKRRGLIRGKARDETIRRAVEIIREKKVINYTVLAALLHKDASWVVRNRDAIRVEDPRIRYVKGVFMYADMEREKVGQEQE